MLVENGQGLTPSGPQVVNPAPPLGKSTLPAAAHVAEPRLQAGTLGLLSSLAAMHDCVLAIAPHEGCLFSADQLGLFTPALVCDPPRLRGRPDRSLRRDGRRWLGDLCRRRWNRNRSRGPRPNLRSLPNGDAFLLQRPGITKEGHRFRTRHRTQNRRSASRSNSCRERSRRGRTLRCLAPARNRNGAGAVVVDDLNVGSPRKFEAKIADCHRTKIAGGRPFT